MNEQEQENSSFFIRKIIQLFLSNRIPSRSSNFYDIIYLLKVVYPQPKTFFFILFKSLLVFSARARLCHHKKKLMKQKHIDNNQLSNFNQMVTQPLFDQIELICDCKNEMRSKNQWNFHGKITRHENWMNKKSELVTIHIFFSIGIKQVSRAILFVLFGEWGVKQLLAKKTISRFVISFYHFSHVYGAEFISLFVCCRCLFLFNSPKIVADLRI